MPNIITLLSFLLYLV